MTQPATGVGERGGFIQTHRWTILLVLMAFMIMMDGIDEYFIWTDRLSLWGMSLMFLGVIGAVEKHTWLRVALGVPVIAWFVLLMLSEFGGIEVNEPLAAVIGIMLIGSMAVSFRQLFAPMQSEYERMSSGVYGYLMLSVLWGLIYWRIEAAVPGSFALPDGTAPDRATFIHLSMVTMTTLGYGDIAPASGMTRMLTGFQAIAGTMFVAIFIGRSVGRKI